MFMIFNFSKMEVPHNLLLSASCHNFKSWAGKVLLVLSVIVTHNNFLFSINLILLPLFHVNYRIGESPQYPPVSSAIEDEAHPGRRFTVTEDMRTAWQRGGAGGGAKPKPKVESTPPPPIPPR